MKISKAKQNGLMKADATADIELINRFTLREFSPDEVFTFKTVLCDNEVDRDGEYFTSNTLKKFVGMFEGRTGISNHQWLAENQVARIYRTSLEKTDYITKLNEPLLQLVAGCYIPRTEDNKSLIDSIESGITKEVSISCRIKQCNCSICGKPMQYDWRTSTEHCDDGHCKGEIYNGKLCAAALEDPEDAFEFSFVAVPAQRRAGVTKSAEDVNDAVKTLLDADLTQSVSHSDFLRLLQKMKAATIDREEMTKRAKILEDNKRFLTK